MSAVTVARWIRRLACALACSVFAASMLSGCDRSPERAVAPSPSEVLADATGHYCGMLLVDHEGPKGQIHLASRADPVWFSSVRDTIAFLRLPEEARDITAVYVNDMARTSNWAQPEAGAWVDARVAWFVIESARRGGMGAPEAIPFSEQPTAERFREEHGGRVVRLDDIPDAYVLGPVDPATPAAAGTAPPRHGGPARHEAHGPTNPPDTE